MRRQLWPCAAILFLLAGVHEVDAQVEAGRYQFSAMIGYQDYAGSSALKGSVLGALDASYYITESIALGFFAQASRPKTDPTFFPLVRLSFGIETEEHQPSEHVTSYVAGVQGRFSKAVGQVTPHLVGGIGYYGFNLDPEQNRSDEYRDGFSLTFGAGASYALSPSAGITLEVRDFVFLDYDRDWFNLSDPLFAEPRFPQPGGEPPAKEDTIHNLRFTVGFSYIPGAGR